MTITDKISARIREKKAWDRGAHISGDSCDGTVECADQLHDDESEYAECVCGAGEPGSGEADREARVVHGKLSAHARRALDCFGESKRAELQCEGGSGEFVPAECDVPEQQPIFAGGGFEV